MMDAGISRGHAACEHHPMSDARADDDPATLPNPPAAPDAAGGSGTFRGEPANDPPLPGARMPGTTHHASSDSPASSPASSPADSPADSPAPGDLDPGAALDLLLAHAPLGIVLSRNGRVQRANPRIEQWLGWPAGSLAGRPIGDCWPGAADAEGAVSLDLERELLRRDGSSFAAHVRVRAFDRAAPCAGGTLWIVENVSDRQRDQRALAAARHEADLASESRRSLRTQASHQIRTPLNALLGLVRLALAIDPQRPDAVLRQRAYLERLADSAQLVGDAVADALDQAPAGAGRPALRHEVFDLHGLLEGFRNTHAELARLRGLDLRLRIGRGVPHWVDGDPTRLRQLLAAFAANALRYTLRGRIGLSVSALDDARLRFEVIDSGPGIAPEAVPRLFHAPPPRPGTQSIDANRPGLTLTECREMAESMGGAVGVISALGDGARFWLELPMPSARPARERPGKKEIVVRTLQGARILLAEDNPMNTLVGQAMLEQWGAVVTPAADGAQAVDAVLRGDAEYDAVLAATAAIRARFDANRLPIIALTADASVSERDAALQNGLNDFLSKPVDLDHVAQVLARWVRHARRTRRQVAGR